MQPISPVLPSSDLREVVYAKDQKEYLPLVAVQVQYSDGIIGVVTRWKLSFKERLQILFFGSLWVQLLTSGSPQPIKLSTVEMLKGEF